MRVFQHLRMGLGGLALLVSVSLAQPATATVVDFEDLSLAANSYEYGANLKGSFTSASAVFNNFVDPVYGSWEGWAYSNQTDSATPGFGNQYSAYLLPLGDTSSTNQFGIAFTTPYTIPDVHVVLPAGQRATSIDLTNMTWPALIIQDGDPYNYARQFVAGDWFKVTISGQDGNGNSVGTPVDFFLADYRGILGAPDILVHQWMTVDLSSLGDARVLVFTQDSTDKGGNGVNTPTYVAVDNLVLAAVPEPATWLLAMLGSAFFMLVVRRRRG